MSQQSDSNIILTGIHLHHPLAPRDFMTSSTLYYHVLSWTNILVNESYVIYPKISYSFIACYIMTFPILRVQCIPPFSISM